MVNKEWECPKCGQFEAVLAVSICPTCKSRLKRVFLTAPSITRASYQRTNKLMESTLTQQNIRNYTNATGQPKATFSNEFQHESGLVAGYGMDFLKKQMGGGALARLNTDKVLKNDPTPYDEVDVSAMANLAASVEAGARINSRSHLVPRTNTMARDPMEYK